MTLERLDDPQDCGCAPTESERRSFWPSLSRRNLMTFGAVGAVALGTVGVVAGPRLSPAFAIAGYPSWDDVVRAKANESAKAAEITRIQGLIAALASEVQRTQDEVVARSNEYYAAQQAYLEAAYRADQLQSQADAAGAEATSAASKAAKVAAQLYRNGGDDATVELFLSGSAATADDLLSRLGTMDKIVDRNRSAYAQAVTARDAAQSLTDQADVARGERDRLQQEAEAKMVAAQQAADAAQAALAAQQANQVTLEAQLAALQDATAKTTADYQAGVEAERKAREERERREREEADRRAREAAAAAANNGGGGNPGGSGGGGGGGSVGGSGWARPSSAGISSGYGPRAPQCTPSYCASSFHLGLDFAAGCGASTYAASAGTVTYAGWNGGYGNYIRIDHGNGIATGYAHSSRILVSRGQWVSAGQAIGTVGLTGNVFGCHLHFEVYTPSGTVNPQPFLRDRGVNV